MGFGGELGRGREVGGRERGAEGESGKRRRHFWGLSSRK